MPRACKTSLGTTSSKTAARPSTMDQQPRWHSERTLVRSEPKFQVSTVCPAVLFRRTSPGRCHVFHSHHPCAARGLSSSDRQKPDRKDSSMPDMDWNPLKMRWAALPDDAADNETACTLRLANMINAFRFLAPPDTLCALARAVTLSSVCNCDHSFSRACRGFFASALEIAGN